MTRRSYTSLFSVLRGKVQSYKLSSLFFINASVLFTIIVIYYIPYVWYYFVGITAILCLKPLFCWYHHNIVFVGIFLFVWPQYGVCGHYFVGMTTKSCLWPLFCLNDHNIVFVGIFCLYDHNIVFVTIILCLWPQYRVCDHYFDSMTTILCLWPLFCF